jgi:hypothetical protein
MRLTISVMRLTISVVRAAIREWHAPIIWCQASGVTGGRLSLGGTSFPLGETLLLKAETRSRFADRP